MGLDNTEENISDIQDNNTNYMKYNKERRFLK